LLPSSGAANTGPLGEGGSGAQANGSAAAPARPTYEWRQSADPAFFPGRQAEVLSNGAVVGHFGVVHPEVLAKFDITNPTAALELNIEPFLFDQNLRPLPVHLRDMPLPGAAKQ
jgi:phenylalanyl-tRNA synthetase beta chain